MNRPHRQVLDEWLTSDAEFAEVYRESEPAFMVAREVLRARGELGITQADLARRVGTSQSVISRLENMEGSPNLRTVVALAAALERRVELRFVDPLEVEVLEPSEMLVHRAQELVTQLETNTAQLRQVLHEGAFVDEGELLEA